MSSDSSPLITAPSVTLRCFVEDDAGKAFRMSREEGLRTWLPDQVCDSEAGALEVLRYLIEKCRDPGEPSLAPYVLGVRLHGSPELIGHVGLSPLGEQVEIGYAIEDRHQGKGYASEAVRAMAEWALVRFELPRVLGVVASDNMASCRVLERAGFKLVDESLRTLHGRSGLVRRYERASVGSDAASPVNC